MLTSRVLSRGLLAGACLTALGTLYYLGDYVLEQRQLRDFLAGRPALTSSGDPLARTRALTQFIATLPQGETTGRVGYINPLYRFLRARPLEVVRYGGFCGNKSRLLLTFLRMDGIPSRLTYLFNEKGLDDPKIGYKTYVTAFVEVEIDGRWIVADPLLGVVFENAAGLPATTDELAEAPSLITQQAPPWYTPGMFDYRDVRHFHWAKFPGGERLRVMLQGLGFGEGIDTLSYPFWAHRPNLVLALGFAMTTFLLLACGLLLRQRSPRSMPRAPNGR